MRGLWDRLRLEERGAQAAEYAMLGGVCAAACGALVALLKNKSTVSRLMNALFDGLVRLVGQWT
jgi:Flp pilus assembly pilin Flp